MKPVSEINLKRIFLDEIKTRQELCRGFGLLPDDDLLSWGDPTLPSALDGFTTEFGMGSGGSRPLLSSGVTGCFGFPEITQFTR